MGIIMAYSFFWISGGTKLGERRHGLGKSGTKFKIR